MNLLAVVALMLAAVSSPPAEPHLVVEPQRWGILTGLPSVLENEEVRRQLRSGLTTSLVFTVGSPSPRSSRFGGAGRVEIRYEPWDEVFLVSTIGIDGVVIESTFSSDEELDAWWSTLELRVLDLELVDHPTRKSVPVILKVVPFSHAEQKDTQRWYSESVHQSARNTDERPGAARGSADPLERMFSVLIATSIQRRPLISFEWSLEWPSEVDSR